MSFELAANNLRKKSFYIHCVSDDGGVLSRKITRSKLFAAIRELSSSCTAMEACPSAHHWGRLFQGEGHQALPIHPRFVKPFVRVAKTHVLDAEVNFEAENFPTKRFIPIKAMAQQDPEALQRVHERLALLSPVLRKAKSHS